MGPAAVTSPKKARYSCRKRRTKDKLISVLASNVRKSNYRRVFSSLLALGPAARRAFRSVMGKVIAREMSRYSHEQSHKFPSFNGSESVKSFNWSNVFTELRDTIPTLYAAINSSMPKKLRENKDDLGYALCCSCAGLTYCVFMMWKHCRENVDCKILLQQNPVVLNRRWLFLQFVNRIAV